MRYADTKSPRVKFLLIGVERDQFSIYKNGTGKLMESQSTLENFRVYTDNRRYEYGYPDVVYLMTGYDAYAQNDDGTKSTNVLGLGFVGGLCTKFFVALGEDVAGTYSGMHTLTHEGGHVLGASHDQSSPKSWIPGDPGSLSCAWSEGHIMSYVDGGERHHRFSRCSLKQIRNLVILRGEVCWRVSISNTGHTAPGRYPGMAVAPNEFCKSVFPNERNVTADMHSDRMAQCMIKCQYPVVRQHCFNSRYCTTYTSMRYTYQHALDYMHCTTDKVCVRGVCGGSTVKVPQRTVTTSPSTQRTTPSVADTSECRCDCSSTTTRIVYGYPPRSWPVRHGIRRSRGQ
uniref:Reprolysin n=1 Tax=Rhipicephalus zambeziensis TaxID=60191 RepID=A0A224YE98_9ACAR